MRIKIDRSLTHLGQFLGETGRMSACYNTVELARALDKHQALAFEYNKLLKGCPAGKEGARVVTHCKGELMELRTRLIQSADAICAGVVQHFSSLLEDSHEETQVASFMAFAFGLQARKLVAGHKAILVSDYSDSFRCQLATVDDLLRQRDN